MAEAATKIAFDEMHKVWTETKGVIDRMEGESKSRGEAMAETKEMLAKYNDRLDSLETKLNRPALPARETTALSVHELPQLKAWDKLMRKGQAALGPEELKLLTVGDDTTGGYLAPVEYVGEIIKGEVEFSPIRALARIRSTSQRAVQWPVRTSTASAAWVAESGTRSETTNPRYGLKEIPTHEQYALADIALQDLEDSAFNLEEELNMEFTEQFGVAEGTAFVTGNGVGKPEGFMFHSGITTVNSGDANLLTSDGLIALFYSPKTVYSSNGTWAMNRQTIRTVRQMKDGLGNYLWQPNFALNRPPTILERPYIEAPDMDAITANLFPVAFGDFRRGYLVVDRVMMSVQRDPFTQAATGAVRFHARKRVGGQVILAEAIVKQKVAA
jgi:HK97 family phage major capsid protein